MIPRHSLPFGIGTALAALVRPAPAVQVSDVEKTYADALGVGAVILLPSVRAGIHMAVQAVNTPGMIVAGPAYTCHTVHEALALSGARTRLVDSAPGLFLMPSDAICAAIEPGCALVLSEVYGIPYDQDMLQNASRKGPSVRVLDMAMSIPAPERMRQLEARDVALFSFGWGKPMYTGWGGIACFQDLELAGNIREIRDQWIAPESSGLRFQRSCSTLLQVAMNQPILYGLVHEQHLYRLYKKCTSSRCEQGHSPTAKEDASYAVSDLSVRTLPDEWTRPMTALNRKLALHNLRSSAQNAGLRHRQAEIYSRTLVESGIVRGSGSKVLPQSHFPIRLPSAVRDKMGDYLRGRGIDTSTLFPLPAGLSRDRYHHAAKAADEVIALPLGPTITLDDVRAVSGCFIDGLRALGL
jgi:dTDP-4-amino-4,6-dideoxygalactose transaminase